MKGAPFKAITDAAGAEHADLVVMGRHGRTGLSRLVLGSVAARVAATSPCPVLTVHGASPEFSEIRSGQAAQGGGERQGDPGERRKAEESGGARGAPCETQEGQ